MILSFLPSSVYVHILDVTLWNIGPLATPEQQQAHSLNSFSITFPIKLSPTIYLTNPIQLNDSNKP